MSADSTSFSPSASAPAFRLAGSGFAYGDRVVLAPFSLDLTAGETVAILGASGCGKSTLLRLIAGLLLGQPSSLAGQVAWMAQQDLLLPWLTLFDNVLLGARLRGEVPDIARTQALLARLGLADRANAMPASLSGGMRQRAALARTLMEDRPLVLMDEPFSALDAITRAAMQELASEVLSHRAVLLVTHDPAEACRLADRIFVLSGAPAVLQQVAVLPPAAPRDPLSPPVLPVLRNVQAALQKAVNA
ncbi:ABC transporter ATP-binding protein [Ferrovibrio sp.]|uniref:ABC transporter ATP-binding protein n=1 Tax=Ferrovibrio sp. TaxID=1917215 RepID=UPI0025BA176D|nr:ABC transporter ATP-binding protein [Ferrovibrio sp.]